MPTKRVWLGHAPDRVQIDRIELDATAVVAEGTDLVFKVNGKELPVENPHPVADDDTAAAGDTAGVLTLLQAAEAAINSSEIPEFAELEAETESPDTDPESPYHRMSVSSRQPGIPFTLEVSAPNPTIDIDIVQAGAPGINEKQSYYITPTPTTGSHRIKWNFGSGVETSGTIPLGADADDVKAAMVAGMTTITQDNVIVTGANTPTDPFLIELTDDLAETSFGLLAVDVSELTGNGKVTISTIQDGGSGGAGSNIVTDTFTDSNGTALTSHTADTSETWSNTAGDTPEIQNNKLWFNEDDLSIGSDMIHLLSADPAADFEASIDLEFGDVSTPGTFEFVNMGLVFRYTDLNNYYRATVEYRAAGDTPSLRISKKEGGAISTVAVTDITDFDKHETVILTVTCQGSSIEAVASFSGGGTHTVSTTQSFNQSEDGFGLYCRHNMQNVGSDTWTMDNLVVDALTTQNEKWAIYTNGQGGEFTLSKPGAGTTNGISPGATTATLKSELESIYGGTFAVTGSGISADPWITDAGGALAGTDQLEPAGDGTNLAGGFEATVAEVQNGSPPLDTIWDVTIHNTTSGDFQFEFKGRSTTDIAYGAVAATVLAALEGLVPGDFSGLWTVLDTGIGSADYRITASGRLAGEPQLLIAHNEDLVGTALGITHTTIQLATGRNWIDNPVNYRDVATGLPGLPETGDELFVQTGDETSSLRYGSLAGRQLKRFILGSLFSGHIGLPEVNPAGYAEYRPTHITLEFEAGTQSPDNPNVLIGVEQGQGSGLMRLKTGTDEVHMRVERTGGPAEDARPSFCWDGQNVANTLNLIEGFVGTAVFAFTAADLEHVTQRGGLLRFGEGTAIGSGGFDHTAGETLGRATLNGAALLFGG